MGLCGREGTSMALSIFPITPNFAAEIGDVDLSQSLAAPDLTGIRAAFEKYAVLVFPGQQLRDRNHLDFAAHFGPIETTVESDFAFRGERRTLPAELVDVSNIDAGGAVWSAGNRLRTMSLVANRLWHTDSSFKTPSGYASLLYAQSIAPIGGHTEFADLRAAYEDLPTSTKRQIDDLVAEHSLMYSRARIGFSDFTPAERTAFEPVRRRMVRTIGDAGRRTLYIASHVGRIVGMDDSAAAALVEQLLAHATQRQYVYAHRWRTGDLVMWDNRCTMHRGTEYDDLRWPRVMQRVTTSDVT
jgi:alpha-ketoglutarate-dependent 2,4-dichlorophenoxyacetate dioxygenase